MAERRWLLLLVGLVIAANSLVGGYLWLSGRDTRLAASIAQSKSAADIEIPVRLTQVSRDRALFPTLTNTGLVRFWNPAERVLAESRTDGTQYQTLAIVSAFTLRSIVWAPGGNALAALTDTGKEARWRIFDLRTQVWHPLSLGTIAVAFSPRGDQIAYLERSGEGGRLAVSFIDGIAPKTVLSTRVTSARLFWPAPELIAFVAADPQEQLESLYTVSLDGQLRHIIGPERGLDVAWALDGSRFVASWFDLDDTLQTAVLTPDGEPETLLLETLAQKCGWRGSTEIICAVPKNPLSAQGYGRAVVYDTLFIFRKGSDGTWTPTDVGTRQSLSIDETISRGTTTVLHNAIDSTLWALTTW